MLGRTYNPSAESDTLDIGDLSIITFMLFGSLKSSAKGFILEYFIFIILKFYYFLNFYLNTNFLKKNLFGLFLF